MSDIFTLRDVSRIRTASTIYPIIVNNNQIVVKSRNDPRIRVEQDNANGIELFYDKSIHKAGLRMFINGIEVPIAEWSTETGTGGISDSDINVNTISTLDTGFIDFLDKVKLSDISLDNMVGNFVVWDSVSNELKFRTTAPDPFDQSLNTSDSVNFFQSTTELITTESIETVGGNLLVNNSDLILTNGHISVSPLDVLPTTAGLNGLIFKSGANLLYRTSTDTSQLNFDQNLNTFSNVEFNNLEVAKLDIFSPISTNNSNTNVLVRTGTEIQLRQIPLIYTNPTASFNIFNNGLQSTTSIVFITALQQVINITVPGQYKISFKSSVFNSNKNNVVGLEFIAPAVANIFFSTPTAFNNLAVPITWWYIITLTPGAYNLQINFRSTGTTAFTSFNGINVELLNI